MLTLRRLIALVGRGFHLRQGSGGQVSPGIPVTATCVVLVVLVAGGLLPSLKPWRTAVALAEAGQASAQQSRAATGKPGARATGSWTMPRTPDGRPDLQGVWENNAVTPLERPKQFTGKPTLTAAEMADLQQRVDGVLAGGDAVFFDELINNALAGNTNVRSSDGRTGNYSQVWLSERVLENRTSLIVDPPDGRVPPQSPAAQQRATERAAARKLNPPSQIEALGLMTRCVSTGVPNIFAGYNSMFEIVQSPDVVVVRTEMIHDARVVPLDGRPHLAASLQQLHGDSRGRWDGDTLVVDTTNFSPRSNFRGANENLHLIERFTRVDADTLNYEITLNDSTTWTRPWTILIKLRRSSDPLLEYACHEGNRGIEGILSAQRE